jgi:hypothetical protein
MSKKQNLLTKFFAKNKLVESTDHETGLPDAASREVSIENTDEGMLTLLNSASLFVGLCCYLFFFCL